METKEIKIQVPEGYEIDKENSTFECIKFKPKSRTYKDVTDKLFKGRKIYPATFAVELGYLGDHCISISQSQKLHALNKLINVAKHLNGDWEPNFIEQTSVPKWYLIIDKENITIYCRYTINYGIPCFKSEELAEQAIEILGEETIKLALSQV